MNILKFRKPPPAEPPETETEVKPKPKPKLRLVRDQGDIRPKRKPVVKVKQPTMPEFQTAVDAWVQTLPGFTCVVYDYKYAWISITMIERYMPKPKYRVARATGDIHNLDDEWNVSKVVIGNIVSTGRRD